MSDPDTEARAYELLEQSARMLEAYGDGLMARECREGAATLRAALEQAGRAMEKEREKLLDLRRRSRQPLEMDISDYSDERCEGFLAGQTHALDVAMASFGSARG